MSPPASLRTLSPGTLRSFDLVMGVGLLLVAAQLLCAHAEGVLLLALRAGDVALATLLLRAARRAQQDLVRLGLDPILIWAETAAAYAFAVVTTIMAAGRLMSPPVPMPGIGAVSAIGKILLLGMAVSLRLRTLQRARTGVAQHAMVITPAAAVVVSFALAITMGWLLLALPEATRGINPIHALDALFTSTSATCVTGLIVVDTPVVFGRFGLTVIILLIQAGGLGIMTLGGMFSAALGQRVSLQQRVVARDTIIIRERGPLANTFRNVARYTLVCEGIGAALLFVRWWTLGEAPGRAAALATFHAVSAFCNAGFSLFSNNLEGYVGDPWVNIVITGLIVVGGLGFPVSLDVLHFLHERRSGQRARLSLHSQLTLITTACLLVLGFVGFLVLEWRASLQPFPLSHRLWAAWFQSVTPRTAGFNTVPTSSLRDATCFLMVILMFIGASPGSTGGGIKTTTLAVLALLSGAMIHGRSGVHFRGREISEAVRHRAVAIIILFGLSVLVWTFFLAITETPDFLDLLFEVASAFGTVGLSTAGSSNLSSLGRIAIVLAMFMGRVGPLTIALALATRRRKLELRHPEEPVMVG